MTTSKGGRPAKGAIKWRRNKTTGVFHWHARVTLKNGKRPFAPLDPSIPREDEARAKACAAETSAYYRQVGATDENVRETFAEYAKRWLADRDGRIASVEDNRIRIKKHVVPILGPFDVRTLGREEIERVRDDLDRKIALDEEHEGHMAWRTASAVWTLVTTLFDDAVNSKRRELRVRKDNPTKDVRGPDRGASKAKQYLYPSEFLQFVTCKDVPLRWRRAVAIAIYTYTRDGEGRELRFDGGDIDLEHGVLSITRALNRRSGKVESTKSGETRRFALEPALLPLLRAMSKAKGGKGTVLTFPSTQDMARCLRSWLWRAGVRRPELHSGSPTRKRITWHDLRATGLTWMAIRGDDPLKIKQRAGHSSFSTTEIYIREAEAVREGFGEVFPPLPETLFGLGEVSDQVSVSDRLGARNTEKTSSLDEVYRFSRAIACSALGATSNARAVGP